MKRRYYLLLLLILVLPQITAGSVSISPAYFIEHFEPSLEKSFSFNTFNSNKEDGIGIELEGDLAKYANVSVDYIQSSGRFSVNLKLPEKLDKPGVHIVYVKVFESKNETGSFVGSMASIRAPIKIIVPYPGKYTESTIRVSNVNKGENARYELNVKNLGTDDVEVDTLVEVFKIDNDGEKVLSNKLDDLYLESKRELDIVEDLNTSSLSPGEYFVKATIDYGKTEIINTTFKIGQFLVDITDYDYLFERGKINKFNIKIENKWNTKIESVYGDVTITDSGKVVSTFRTISLDTEPWEIKNITGFFDTEGLESKRYLANIQLYYGDSKSSKLVAIYVQDPPKEKSYLVYILIGVAIISALIIVAFVILISKIKKLKGQVTMNNKNGKKK
jgi:hypothetical protein